MADANRVHFLRLAPDGRVLTRAYTDRAAFDSHYANKADVLVVDEVTHRCALPGDTINRETLAITPAPPPAQ